MQRFLFTIMICLIVCMPLGCSRDETALAPAVAVPSAELDQEVIAGRMVEVSGWGFHPDADLPPRVALLADKDVSGDLLDYGYEVLTGDVAHYWWDIPVGAGEYDKIRVHRVVKEKRPGKPERTLKSIFLLHGDAVGFAKFLFGAAAPSVPDQHALAVHLAAEGVDVWGMDQNWVLVPVEVTDHGFMADWGLQNQVDNLRAGLTVARAARLFSGNLGQRMILLGYSSGVWTTGAYLNEESQMPEWRRHVCGWVPADNGYKLDPANADGVASQCMAADDLAQQMAGGMYADPTGQAFAAAGYLSAVDPDGASPIIPGLTNLQTMFFFGGLTYNFAPVNDWWHYFGTAVEDGQITDFTFTPLPWAQEFVQLAAPWEAVRFVYDYSVLQCDAEDVPFDDHLGDITVPVFSINPVGGLALSSEYYLGLLGSTDVTIHEISLLPPEQIAQDYGHIDIWTAADADLQVWQPVAEWVETHSEKPGGGNRWVAGLN